MKITDSNLRYEKSRDSIAKSVLSTFLQTAINNDIFLLKKKTFLPRELLSEKFTLLFLSANKFYWKKRGVM